MTEHDDNEDLEDLEPEEYMSFLQFVSGWKYMQDKVHENAVQKGWWQTDRNDGEMLMLIVSELAEALEALRNGNPKDEKCPEFLNFEIELADAVIRIMDFAAKRNLRVSEAMLAKHFYNKTRPIRHGKLF